MGGEEVLPCPFCGSRAVRVREVPDDEYYVHCAHCEADGPICISDGRAVLAWNGASRCRHAVGRDDEAEDYAALERSNERMRRTWDVTAEHLRKTRERLRETTKRLGNAMEHAKTLARDNADLVYDLRGDELTMDVPPHYRGDGLVSAARALKSATVQPAKTERTETGFYWWALAFKYVWSLWSKGQAEQDARKAIDCLKRVIGEIDHD